MKSSLLLALIVAALLADAAAPAGAQNRSQTRSRTGMHPDFALLDGGGQPVAETGVAPVAVATCGSCHDADFIRSHSTHSDLAVTVDCFTCHVTGGIDSLNLDRPAASITAATSVICGQCHGYVDYREDPVEIDAELLRAADPGPYAATLRTGAVFAPERMSDSFLNLAGKAGRTQSWDVHATRQLNCTTCHTAPNRPGRRPAAEGGSVAHLSHDPRSLGIGEYLQRPDHRLVTADCRSCHDAAAAHPDLPYRQRHLDALDCQACHVPALMAPSPSAVDWTAVTPEGGPRMEYRGIGETEWNRPNTWYNTGYRPFLLPVVEGERSYFAPYNVVARWEWVEGASGLPVPAATVERAWRGADSSYAPDVVHLLDTDTDGRVSSLELVLDTPEKTAAIAARLAALGVEAPRIAGTVTAHRVRHGTAESRYAGAACASCHTPDSRLGESIPLSAGALPGGVVPQPDASLAALLGARQVETTGDRLQLGGNRDLGEHFVFGHTRNGWIDTLGLLLLLSTTVGVATHAGMRARVHRRRAHRHQESPRQHNPATRPAAAHVAGQRVYMYSQYERLWHWIMAVSIILLLLTGFQVRFPGSLDLFAYPTAILAHNILAGALILNGFLSLFYHLATAEIGQFIPKRTDLLQRVLLQVRFYVRGIFRGEAHPGRKTPEHKLNPLQQITYVGLLNVLFPLQIVTGVLIWTTGWWPHLASGFGGLSVVAPLHDLGSWLFLSFLVMHVYLITTGHTVGANLRAMVTGWEPVEADSDTPDSDTPDSDTKDSKA